MRMKTYMGFLAVVLALAGCDDGDDKTDAGMTDAGMVTGDDGGGMTGDDGGGMTGDDDGGMTGETCEGARTVALEMGEQTITGDTTGMSSDLTLSEGCGGEPAPQELLAFVVPGSGQKTVTFDLAVDGTDLFDTVIEVRPAGCDSVVDAVCFDDVAGDDWRSAGHFVAEGGSTVYLVVSTYVFPDEEAEAGPWTMVVNVEDGTPAPTLTGDEVLRIDGEEYRFLLDGTDPWGRATSIIFSMLDSAGTPIPFNDGTVFIWDLNSDVAGQTSFTGARADVTVAEFIEATSEASEAQVTLLNHYGFETAPLTIPVRNVTRVERDEACGTDAICTDDLECIDSTCQTPAAVIAACGAASALTPTPATPASATGTLEPGTTNLFAGTCGLSAGGEDLYTVTVPAVSGDAIAYDLIASTDNTVSADAEADTLVYIQSTCGDAASELACHDDIDYPDNPRSLAIIEDAAEGTYTVVVDTYFALEASTDYQLDVSLRPVLGAGATCDPAGVDNRCSTGACPTSGDPECPAAP